jgi:glycosyltransferase involved in cell wall biosynthesis
MNISVCITVYNEEKTIESFLKSLLNQTIKPREIIIVDAGSKDKTTKIIKKYPKVKLLISKGASIAKGRNIAIKHSKYSVIAITDAGCVAKKNWLRNITEPLKNKNNKVVAGFYIMTGDSKFQKSLRHFLGVTPENFDKNTFLPSARSMAFKKSVWKKLHGFDERFNRAGEDHDFALRIKNNNYKIVCRKNAIVYWEIPNNLRDAFNKFYLYSKGDTQGSKFLTSHNIHSLTVISRYIIMLTLIIISLLIKTSLVIPLLFFLLYIFWSYLKAGLWGIIIQLASDIAVMLGFLSGIYGLLTKNN